MACAFNGNESVYECAMCYVKNTEAKNPDPIKACQNKQLTQCNQSPQCVQCIKESIDKATSTPGHNWDPEDLCDPSYRYSCYNECKK